MNRPGTVTIVLLCAAAAVRAQAQTQTRSAPRELSHLLVNAHIELPVAGWCRADFERNRRSGFAVAVLDSARGGRFVAMLADGTPHVLGSFEGAADLSCYTLSAARKLNSTLQRSDTIQGSVAPLWPTTVVCGFVEPTTAACWQYSPAAHQFVKVGEWTT